MPQIIIAFLKNPVVKNLAMSAGSAIFSTVAGFCTQQGLEKVVRSKAANTPQ
jgi:hypothetical protein